VNTFSAQRRAFEVAVGVMEARYLIELVETV
jgi:hypothetical protein